MNVLEAKNLPIEKYSSYEYRFIGKDNKIISIFSSNNFESLIGLRFVDADLKDDLRFKFISLKEKRNLKARLTLHIAKNEADFLAKFNELAC